MPNDSGQSLSAVAPPTSSMLSTPIWLGHPSSITQRVLERLDAELSDCAQGLNDIGFSFAAQANTYWTGEAMQSTDYSDLDEVPEPVAKTTASVARNAIHLASLLTAQKYPSNP